MKNLNQNEDAATESNIWQLNFKIKYKNIEYIRDFLELVSDSMSISNYESDTIEINPEDIWQVDLYFTEKPNIEGIKSHLNSILEQNNIEISDWNFFELENQDWVSIVQEKFKPFNVGRFFITSSHYKDECPNDRIPVVVEASCAFGTGEHHTTKSCIEALEYLSNKKLNNILDMGTGTGILAIAASHIWFDAYIVGSDIDPMSIEISKNNAFVNSRKNLNFINSDGYSNEFINKQSFDLIISNILAQPLINFAPDIAKHTIQEGFIILSGFLDTQAENVIKTHEKVGFKLIKTINRENWVTVIMQKTS